MPQENPENPQTKMASDRQLLTLKKKRSVFKGQLTIFKHFVESFSQNANYTLLQAKLSRIEYHFNEVLRVQSDIECLDMDHDYTVERAELENEFDEWSCKARDMLRSEPNTENSSAVASTQQSHTTNVADADVRLPQISLPTFSGSYDDWPSFADQFKSSVHDNNSINDSKKLTYLRSCLTDEAACTIRSLDNAASNYRIAWALLAKKYNQPAIVAYKHIGALLIQPSAFHVQRDLHKFLNDTESHYEAIKAKGQLTVDNILVYSLTSQLDSDTLEKWKEMKKSDFPTVDELLEFLRERCKIKTHNLSDASSSIRSAKPRNGYNVARHPMITRQNASNRQVFATHSTPQCAVCKQAHYTSFCDDLTKLNTRERLSLVKQLKLCVNCLRSNHSTFECKSSKCRKCNKKHNTILHIENDTAPSHTNTDITKPATDAQSVNTLSITAPSEVLLFTAIITIHDATGHAVPCRVLLDSCSQTSLLTEQMANKLKLKRNQIDIPLNGANNMQSRVNQYVTTKIKSRHNDFSAQLNFLVVPTIASNLPSRHFNKALFDIPKNIRLADPNYNKPAEIDGLVAAELFGKLLCIGQILLNNSEAVLQKTQFGWVISGSSYGQSLPKHIHCKLTTTSQLERDMQRFWEVEEGETKKQLSPEEALSESHYERYTERDRETGRYVVALPFRDDTPHFTQSYSIALKRFYNLERSLARNPELKTQYREFLNEYRELNHMSEMQSADTEDGYFIPHLAVQKISSLTTKVRVVFDASTRDANGVSLNDKLLTGPTIQDDIFSIITRFRSHAYVLTADIAKMYRQVTVRPQDRKYQRILWRENQTDPVKVYELNTVAYGTTAAPFLAVRTLKQLAIDEAAIHPEAAATLQNDFYVDDMLTGGSNYETTLKLRDELINITSKGGFHLRQWASNEPALVADLMDRSSEHHLCLDPDQITKTLGVFWNARDDTIEYRTQDLTVARRVTKRTILAQIAQLYDPLGLLGPVIIKAKILMQQLWQLKLNWDESVPGNIYTAWAQHSQQMPSIQRLKIPRKIIIDNAISTQIHGFCDASERAYGACIYARTTDISNNIHVRLICSKTRVAPLKSLSLPRLELCAAALLVKLFNMATHALKLTSEYTFFWSDSTITLQWINTPSHSLKTFVSNRVAEIQKHTLPHQWKHVASADNPADLISRGLSPHDFLDRHPFWQTGPLWLKQSREHWPQTFIPMVKVPETRGMISLTITTVKYDILHKFSNISKLTRILAYCLRFKYNAKKGTNKLTGSLTIAELQTALARALLMTQRECFQHELQGLNESAKTGKKVNNKLSNLAPFIDDCGLIRVGGRLAHADLPYAHKHPILLPTKHHVSQLIIRDAHTKNYHAGSQATLGAVRQNYWPLHGMSAVKSVITQCVTCRRVKPTTINYNMGDLPANRVTFKRPFLISGVDYCGPFYVKERRHRNMTKVKVYVAVFICFATKAVHLELVENLTTEAFLAALTRFFSRRGRCSDLYSDNASTFVGAQREISDLHRILHSQERNTTITEHLKNESINWHYIPPRSPHHGGLWEAAVRSFKHHLYRVVGETTLSYEALLTCVVEIEGILNSRPLSSLSNDPNDVAALTPGHFIIGDTINGLPQHDLTNIKVARLSVWQQSQKIKQHFWQRWYMDYLHQLTVRKKWHHENPTPVRLGSLVTVMEDNAPPLRWSLGRIVKLHPGHDGTTRVVTVKTASGEYKRSIRKLSPLPVDLEPCTSDA